MKNRNLAICLLLLCVLSFVGGYIFKTEIVQHNQDTKVTTGKLLNMDSIQAMKRIDSLEKLIVKDIKQNTKDTKRMYFKKKC